MCNWCLYGISEQPSAFMCIHVLMVSSVEDSLAEMSTKTPMLEVAKSPPPASWFYLQ